MCKRDLLTFAAESQFVASETSDSADRLADSIFASHKAKRIPVWNATMHADQRDLAFGDSEEMRFGARVTTPNMEEKAVASGIRWDCKLQKQAAAK